MQRASTKIHEHFKFEDVFMKRISLLILNAKKKIYKLFGNENKYYDDEFAENQVKNYVCI